MFPESRLEVRKLLTSRDLTSTSLKQIVYENEPIVSAEQPKSKPAVRDEGNRWYDKARFAGGEAMTWDGDDLAGQAEEVFERQQAAADARAHRGTSTVEERARSAKFETLRLSRSRIMGQLSRATNPAHRTMLESALKSINDEMGEG